MNGRSEYHRIVRHLFSASMLFASLILMPTFFAGSSLAQINAAPSSVTSPGFGGRAINGTQSSVTSLGPRGFSPGPRAGFAPMRGPRSHRSGDNQHRRHHDGEFIPPLYYAVPVPYAVDNAPDDEDAYTNDEGDDQGGPTVFDRRGSGTRSYVPPAQDASPAHEAQPEDDPPADLEPAVPTLLVFKNGTKLEVGNYAIVGPNLFDLTPGHSRRIALADLDLEATRKENEDHGVVFQLPPSQQGN